MATEVRGGVPVHVRRFGSGPEPALMLHCMLAHSGAWTGVAERMAGSWSAAAPDMPGHGRSAAWAPSDDLHDRVTAIAGSFLEDGLHLVGHSFGATVALRLAEAHPERIASLTLIEPVLFAAARETAPELFAAHREASARVDAAARDGDWDEAARRFTGRWGGGDGWDGIPAAKRAQMAAQMPMVLSTGAVLNDDSKGMLAPGAPERLRMPVLLVRGGASAPIMAAVHAGLAARLPTARDRVVEGAGHMVPLSHPGALAELIGERRRAA